LSREEVAFFAAARPAGLILFARNCADPEQVRALIAAFRQAVGSERVLVLVDQEGGRVQRLAAPHWRRLPAAASIGRLLARERVRALELARLVTLLAASELRDLGFNTNCVPVLDIPAIGADEIIGDRAYGRDVETVSLLGRVVGEASLAAGILPVVKHIPGHGRANCDSHLRRPVVGASLAQLDQVDFEPFRRLADLPLAMTAHVVYSAIDAGNPASVSERVIAEVVRGRIGFDGLLLSDDLSMQALDGDVAERTSAVLAAGCDLALHCNGRLDEMKRVGACAPALDGDALRRFDSALNRLSPAPVAFERAEAEAALAEVLGAAAV